MLHRVVACDKQARLRLEEESITHRYYKGIELLQRLIKVRSYWIGDLKWVIEGQL